MNSCLNFSLQRFWAQVLVPATVYLIVATVYWPLKETVTTINWIGQKGHLQFIGSVGHYFTPGCCISFAIYLWWIDTIPYILSRPLFFAKKYEIGPFCHKNTNTAFLSQKSQHKRSQDKFWRKLRIFLTNLTPGKYRENIAIYCIILKYREISFVS